MFNELIDNDNKIEKAPELDEYIPSPEPNVGISYETNSNNISNNDLNDDYTFENAFETLDNNNTFEDAFEASDNDYSAAQKEQEDATQNVTQAPADGEWEWEYEEVPEGDEASSDGDEWEWEYEEVPADGNTDSQSANNNDWEWEYEEESDNDNNKK